MESRSIRSPRKGVNAMRRLMLLAVMLCASVWVLGGVDLSASGLQIQEGHYTYVGSYHPSGPPSLQFDGDGWIYPTGNGIMINRHPEHWGTDELWWDPTKGKYKIVDMDTGGTIGYMKVNVANTAD